MFNNKDQTDWKLQHCGKCTPSKLKCTDPHGVIIGDEECWTGRGLNKVFCPYHVLSDQRYKTMKRLQIDIQGLLATYLPVLKIN